VDEVICRLNSAGQVINREKCEFAIPEVLFLLHHVNAEGILPYRRRWRTSRNIQSQVVNFYRPLYRRLLTDLLKGSPKPTASVDWTRRHLTMPRLYAELPC
jgi:hypothetical protein